MNKEIAANTTPAPTAIKIAFEPLSPLSDVELEVGRSDAVELVWVVAEDCGIPGENGLLGAGEPSVGATLTGGVLAA